MNSKSIVVRIPQLDQWGKSDSISLALAIIAFVAIIGSVLISRHQNNLVIRQMNREERKKLYVPVLAMMAAEWTKFDKNLLIIGMPPGLNSPTIETDENLELLKAKIRSYEFEIEEELLGSKKVSKAIDSWFDGLRAIMDLFEEFQSENLKMSLLPLDADPQWKSKRDALWKDLVRQSTSLQEGLHSIVELVRGEIDMTQKGFFRKFRSTLGAQDIGN